MDIQAFIPTIDPNPLPAPYWIFKLLLIVTFLLHIIVMNFMLGGGVLALIAKLRSQKDKNYERLFNDISKKLPNLLPSTVTLGVAPLLFIQVLYGQYIYTSSIIVGWPWFFVLILLTIAYYGFYIVSFNCQKGSGYLSWVLLLSVVFAFLIGFIYSNNLTLMVTPGKWATKYFADPHGWNLNWGDSTLYPRFLHFFSASLALGGLLIAFIGLFRWNKDKTYARFLIQTGGKWFMYVTMVQFVIGIWYLLSQPREKMMLFMGDNTLGTIAILIGIFGGLAAIFLASDTFRKSDPRQGLYVVSALTLIVLTFMVIMRDILRDAYLANYFKPADFFVKTQWEVFPLFLILFVAGVILWIVMIKQYFFPAQAKSAK